MKGVSSVQLLMVAVILIIFYFILSKALTVLGW